MEQRLKQDAKQVEEALRRHFSTLPRYADLVEAMEYSLLAGGKRIRPVLVLEVCRMCGGDPERAMPFACGVEMIHTYSLIHDDLPAMDDDDLRRGRATNHKVYGEATAILAGDGLLTEAFSALAGADLPPEAIVQGVATLSRAAGALGMVGGQVLDMAGEGRAITREELEQIQSLKTGALLTVAAQLGCIAAGAPPQVCAAVEGYAQAIGRAFQIQDDILDVTGSQEELGKPVGSDREREKATFVSVLGMEESAAQVERLTAQALAALDELEPEYDTGFLRWLAEELARRHS